METTDFVKLTGFMNAGKKDDIQSLFNMFKERIMRLDIPFVMFVSLAKYQEDPISQILLPEELQGTLCAVKTKGDGNCLYNTAAMGIGGNFGLTLHEVKGKCVLSLISHA